MAEYRLTPAALQDIEAIWTYTLQEWGIEQANRYIDRLDAAFAGLANNTITSTPCDHIRPGYRRCNAQRHVIYFRVTPDGIIVVRILIF